jgi:alkanesulfonate monooxygenase SsuD/methylene tetrahydromethanopterin reductase-like flavin-dependent oxidoreductase (luciferase family)
MEFVIYFNPNIRATVEERRDMRPIARNNDRYQEMIELMRKVAVRGDELGYDWFCLTEHHFESEGWEVSVAPLLIITDLAARTKRLKFFPLGCVLPGWNPIRLAEEFAVVDHLTKGRLQVGVARGYQDRWTNIMGQKYQVKGTASDGSDTDAHNRKVFREFLDIMKRAWTEVPLTLDTEHFQIPFPYEEGIRRWPIAEGWTRPFGAPGEVDDEGVVRAVTVVPKPYQEPYPPIVQPFSFSETSVEYCAENGHATWFIVTDKDRLRTLFEVYRDTSIKHGRNVKLGDNLGVMRMFYLANTYQEAYDLGERHLGRISKHFFGGFGFFESLRLPEDEVKYPGQPLPPEEWTYDRMVRAGLVICGTPDDVIRGIRDFAEETRPQRLGIFTDDQMTDEMCLEQLEWFAKDVMPAFR